MHVSKRTPGKNEHRTAKEAPLNENDFTALKKNLKP